MLNFEFNLECYDAAFTQQLDALIDECIAAARPLTLAELRGRSLPVRFRDGVARLGLPYL